ncbi:MAG: hypothetical protein AAGH72_09410 [Verrucomicrobiota bacterium]
MADEKPTSEEKPEPGSAKAQAPKPLPGSKLGSFFSRKSKAREKKPAPKKGQSSFLKNFNVRDVGEESGSPKKAAEPTFQPASKPAENWTSMVGAKQLPEGKKKPTRTPVKLPEFKPSTELRQEPQKEKAPTRPPVALPKISAPKHAPEPASPVSVSRQKSEPKLAPPPFTVQRKAAANAQHLPAQPNQQKPATPVVSESQAPKLLPGQKKGEQVGAASSDSGLIFRDKDARKRPAAKGLPSLAAHAEVPAVSNIPAAKPPVALKPASQAPKPAAVSLPKAPGLPKPPREESTTSILKKESIGPRKLTKPVQVEPQDKPAPKVRESSSSLESIEPEFTQPAIPLGKAQKKTGLLKPEKQTQSGGSQAPEGSAGSTLPADNRTSPENEQKTSAKSPAQVKKSDPSAQTGAKPIHKKSPKVVLPPVRESSGSNKMVILIPLIVLLIAGLAFFVYWIQRETSVEVTVNAGELTTRGDALVVLNFAGKLEMLRNDYIRRRTPVEEEIGHIKANLSAAQGDLAGRNQRKKLLEDALKQYQSEIPEYLNESQEALERLWNEESAALTKNYDDFKESLHQQIEQRAEELGVEYTRNDEIDAIAVAVNAYRLALYGVAQQVNVGEQRSWAEDLLQEWNSFEKSWREKQSEIKQKALEIKRDPIPKISETRKQIDNLEREIDALDTDLNSLKAEVARYESNLVEANSRLQAIDEPFYAELRAIPEQFKVSAFPVDELGKVILPDLQESADLSGGTHFLLVAAVKGDQEYWAIQEFEVLPYQTISVIIDPTRFLNLKTILEKGTFMKP